MTTEELQGLIDTVDAAVHYVPREMETRLRMVSNLLVDLPDETVEERHVRLTEQDGKPSLFSE